MMPYGVGPLIPRTADICVVLEDELKTVPGDYVLEPLFTPMYPVMLAHETIRSKPCPSCGSTQTLRVEITLSGSPVSFTSCSNCEWKGWEREGERLPLGSVLGLVSNR